MVDNSGFSPRSCPTVSHSGPHPLGSPTQALFGLVDEPLECGDLQEAGPLCDGVKQQEAVRPADGGLQGSGGAVLEEWRGQKRRITQ